MGNVVAVEGGFDWWPIRIVRRIIGELMIHRRILRDIFVNVNSSGGCGGVFGVR